jgi:SAM-dependent methyltransferase
MIERWDRAYRDGKRPSWDARQAAPELVRVVEEEEIVKPCRVVVLGCGSGDNAIYLAQQGFDVTAIDLAPTALRIAEKKADEAGVKVNWMLADVLNVPNLEPFEFVFDRGCYHNVRYVDTEGFVESLEKITAGDARCLILSLNRDGPPGIREQTMRDDFAEAFEIDWLESRRRVGRNGENPNGSWSLMLNAKN